MSDSEWQEGYVLHRWLYRETSLLLDLFTQSEGRVRVVAKGSLRSKNPWKAILQPLHALKLIWSGRGELKTLRSAESRLPPLEWCTTPSLYCGLYVNELLTRLLEDGTAYTDLFQRYQQTLMQLSMNPDNVEVPLRIFEFELLRAIGFGIDFSRCDQQQLLLQDAHYRYVCFSGFQRVLAPTAEGFSGKTLRTIARHDFSSPDVRISAKRLARRVLACYLGPKSLRSRMLFQ